MIIKPELCSLYQFQLHQHFSPVRGFADNCSAKEGSICLIIIIRLCLSSLMRPEQIDWYSQHMRRKTYSSVRGEHDSGILGQDVCIVKGSVDGDTFLSLLLSSPFDAIHHNSIVVLGNCCTHHMQRRSEYSCRNRSTSFQSKKFMNNYNP